MCCPGLRRRGVTTRHNLALHATLQAAISVGAATHLEPRPFLNQPRQKPDLAVIFHSTLLTDVIVVQPDAPSRSNVHPSKILQYADRVKIKKYRDQATEIGHTFLPAAATAHGVLSSGFMKVITHLATIADLNHVLPFHTATRTFSDNIVCAIQRGNALIFKQAILAYKNAASSLSSSNYIYHNSDASHSSSSLDEDDGFDLSEQHCLFQQCFSTPLATFISA